MKRLGLGHKSPVASHGPSHLVMHQTPAMCKCYRSVSSVLPMTMKTISQATLGSRYRFLLTDMGAEAQDHTAGKCQSWNSEPEFDLRAHSLKSKHPLIVVANEA